MEKPVYYDSWLQLYQEYLKHNTDCDFKLDKIITIEFTDYPKQKYKLIEIVNNMLQELSLFINSLDYRQLNDDFKFIKASIHQANMFSVHSDNVLDRLEANNKFLISLMQNNNI